METVPPSQQPIAFSLRTGPAPSGGKGWLSPVRATWLSPVRATWLGAAVTILIVIVLSVLMVRHIYRRELDEAKREVLSFNNLLAQQTEQSFQSINLVQRALRDDLQAAGLTGPGDLEQLASGREMHTRLRQLISGLPQLDAVTLIATDGDLVNFSRYWPIPTVNIADRDYFKALSRPDAPDFAFGQPVQNRGSGTWTIYLAERLSGPKREFAGLVLGAMQTSFFESFYQKLNLPEGSSVALWRTDGLLLARFPQTEQIGQVFSNLWSIIHLHPGESVVRVSSVTLDNQSRLIATARLTNSPVVVTTTRRLSAVLADFHLDRDIIIVAATLCSLAVLGLAVLIMRQFRGYEAAAFALLAREEAERALHTAESKLLHSQKLEAIGRLTAGVAHDFNNLLTVVRANAELVAAADRDERVTRRIATICQAADRGAALTRQMLAFSRQQILTPRSLNLNETLGGIGELLRSSVGSRVALEVRLQDGLWPAFADAGQLGQALLNLVLNARDAIAESGTITIRTDNLRIGPGHPTNLPPGDYVRVTVSDTGSGMSSDTASRAFDPFFTTKEQGKGTGLGLSQALGFARQSNGDLMLESAPGQGTQIRILLPRARELSPAGEDPASATARARDHAGRVLLVDAEEAARHTASAILYQHGFHVVEADSAEHALQALIRQPDIDAVLIDHALPRRTGLELARLLRRDAPSRPVVFMTGPGQAAPDGEAVTVRKPFQGSELRDVLVQVLG